MIHLMSYELITSKNCPKGYFEKIHIQISYFKTSALRCNNNAEFLCIAPVVIFVMALKVAPQVFFCPESVRVFLINTKVLRSRLCSLRTWKSDSRLVESYDFFSK